ncbi:MAG TPA: SMC-Scp complex subunit ScpB [Rubrobacteraceae bacterium]|nr:SMC-Scp complex subunit ScpB [Rubrobacteraceae bacterium]
MSEPPTPAPATPAARIEAVLLVSPRPVSEAALKSAAGLSDSELRDAMGLLGERYSPRESGIVLRRVAGGYQLATNPVCASAVERFREESRPAPLSNAAHEVLSCALYLGPLTRAEISAARGVNSDAVVRGLIERGLLAETGSDRESPGAPALLDVTDEFLAATGATSREDFAPLDSLVGPEELARVRERVGAAETGSEQEPATPEES